MGHSRPLFLYFHLSMQLTVDNVQYKFLLMTGFELQTSGIGSNGSINWATTTAWWDCILQFLFSRHQWLDYWLTILKVNTCHTEEKCSHSNILANRWKYFLKSFFLKKEWANSGLFSCIFAFSNSFYSKYVCEKMSIQNTVPGFKLTTFGTWVSSHNH